MNKNDLRYIKTEKIIKNNFIECVKKNGFEKTTVSMICETGLISRNAFYLHFEDKYAVLDSLFYEFEKKISSTTTNQFLLTSSNRDFSSATALYVDTVIENREDFLFLMKCSKKRMENLLKKIIVEAPVKKLLPDYEKKSEHLPVQLNLRYMFSAMVAFTELWLENYDKISREEVICELGNLCEKPTNMFFDKLLL